MDLTQNTLRAIGVAAVRVSLADGIAWESMTDGHVYRLVEGLGLVDLGRAAEVK